MNERTRTEQQPATPDNATVVQPKQSQIMHSISQERYDQEVARRENARWRNRETGVEL